LATAADLGVETIVFGNGGARRVSEGMSREGVWSDLRELAEIMDDFAGKNGVNVVIEPLNKKETNMITSYTEAVKLAEGLKYVSTMCDLYHVQTDGQTLDDLLEYPDMLGHLHIAYSAVRLIPSAADDMLYYDEFIKAVKKIGYNNKLSIEGGLRGEEPAAVEIGKSLEALKKMF
jgi:sugar phosphate isomerase/epimerase